MVRSSLGLTIEMDHTDVQRVFSWQDPRRATRVPSIDELLYISGEPATRSLEYLQSLRGGPDGVTHVFNLAKECICRFRNEPSVQYHHLKLADNPRENISSHFSTISATIAEIFRENPNNAVLVHCIAGVSRSSSFAIAYLMQHKHITASQGLSLVRQSRPQIFPNVGFMTQLLAWERHLSLSNAPSINLRQYKIDLLARFFPVEEALLALVLDCVNEDVEKAGKWFREG